MRQLTCQCGSAVYWDGGIPPAPCKGCSKCGTNYHKQPIEPHHFEPRFSQLTGEPVPPVCGRCYARGEL